QPLHELVRARRDEPGAATPVRRPVLGLLEPLSRRAAPQDDQRPHARRDARLLRRSSPTRSGSSSPGGGPARRRRTSIPSWCPRRGRWREGGVFRFAAAHFEWLLRVAEPLGLSFDD